jgi:hypothetical protein
MPPGSSMVGSSNPAMAEAMNPVLPFAASSRLSASSSSIWPAIDRVSAGDWLPTNFSPWSSRYFGSFQPFKSLTGL